MELAIERDQDIPALIYEGRPTVSSAASPTTCVETCMLLHMFSQGCRVLDDVCVCILLLDRHLTLQFGNCSGEAQCGAATDHGLERS